MKSTFEFLRSHLSVKSSKIKASPQMWWCDTEGHWRQFRNTIFIYLEQGLTSSYDIKGRW